jgi:rubrerythrin
MGFAQEPLPPLLVKVLNEIDGTITRKEWKDLLYKQRITSKDVQYYTRYLKEQNFIIVGKKTIKKEEQQTNGGTLLNCHECGYTWLYKGKAKRVTCPRCKYNNKQTWIKNSSPILT